jgi:hypothetical protein
MKKELLTASGEEIDVELYDDSLRLRILKSRVSRRIRNRLYDCIASPLENFIFSRWLKGNRTGRFIEGRYLPRRCVENYLGDRLNICVNPEHIKDHVSMTHSFGSKRERREAKNAFIWPGDWDLKTFPFDDNPRYLFIKDLWQHREDPSKSHAYEKLVECTREGKPFKSHHKGILLNSEEKVLLYLQKYISYMQDMRERGFDRHKGKDSLGVAIGRHGDILKTNRGLHRLAMAKVLEMDEISVSIKAVHEEWWKENIPENRGEESLEKLGSQIQGLSNRR